MKEISGYLGIDIGGTGAKAGVFDRAGCLLGSAQAAYSPRTTKEGHVEIPIEEVYCSVTETARKAIRASGARIQALSVVSQGQTFVSLDEHDQPLYPAIIWYDSRAARQADQLHQLLLAANAKGPLPLIQPISSAPKIMWLRENQPVVTSRARLHLLLPDYFSYRLTGKAVTDPITASSTGLYAFDGLAYSSAALAAAEIAEAQLARLQPSATPIGKVLPRIAEEWGLDEGALLVTGTNDQFAGAIGAGNCRAGIVSETSGTCLAVVTLTERLPASLPPGLLGGVFPISRYHYALAYAKTAGLVLDWFRNVFCPERSLRELDQLAASVPIGSNGLTVSPHFDGMVSPNPNPTTRGFITNLSLNHALADLYRAILESLCFSLRENLELLRSAGFDIGLIRSIGGGAKSEVWLQMKADVTGSPIERPMVTEAATLGAAMLAAVGAGHFTSLEASSEALYRADRVFEPDAAAHEQYEIPYKNYRQQCARMYAAGTSA